MMTMRAMLMAVVVMAVGCGGGDDHEWGEFYDDGNGGLYQAPCPTAAEAPLAGDGTCTGYSADAEEMIGASAATFQCGDTATGAVIVEGVAGCCVGYGGAQPVRYWYECEAD